MSQPKRSPHHTFSFVAVALIIGVGIFLLVTTSWSFYWVWLITLSIITFILYGYDKGQAKLGGTRVPEVVLHGLALLGGFLGSWLGRAIFRHKTRKTSFTVVLVIATIIHLAIIFFLI